MNNSSIYTTTPGLLILSFIVKLLFQPFKTNQCYKFTPTWQGVLFDIICLLIITKYATYHCLYQ
uniref:Uncharacterized protein n=1 Tax=Ciona intestinalis TaxID=7719 RepID=H2Y189_CIOIN